MLLEVEKRPLPPIRREVWLLLKQYTLNLTKETGKQITLSEVIEKAILKLIEKNKKD